MSQKLGSPSVAGVITDLTAGGRHAINVTQAPVPSIGGGDAAKMTLPSLGAGENLEGRIFPPKGVIQIPEIKPQVVQVQSQERSTVLINMTSGAMAGGLAKTTIAPLDRTKIYFQATKKMLYSVQMAGRFLKNTIEKEGFISLWRGNSATMARILPYASLQYSSHEQYKKLLRVDHPSRMTPSWLRFFCGSLAGVTSQGLVYPLDLVRVRMAVTARKTYSSMSEVFVKTCKNEGIFGLYKGFTPTMLGVIPYAGTSFGIHGTLKHYHKVYTKKEKPDALMNFLFGAIAGAAGQTCSYPLEIVRRRMQTDAVVGDGRTYVRILDTFSKVFREEGLIRGLFKGLSLNWVKGPLSTGISFATFETLKPFFEGSLLFK